MFASCTVMCWRGVQVDETMSIPCTVNSKVSIVQATTRQGWVSGKSKKRGGEYLDNINMCNIDIVESNT